LSVNGKPLRFLGLLVGGWIVLRLGMAAAPSLWAPDEGTALASAPAQRAPAPSQKQIATAPRSVAPDPIAASAPVLWSAKGRATSKNAAPRFVAAFAHERMPAAPLPRIASAPAPREPDGGAARASAADIGHPNVDAPPRIPSRWSLTGWLLWRPDAGASFAQAPLLGGSQGGVRLDYRLWSAGTRSLALYGRMTRALERPFAEEAAVGVALRPVAGLPVSLLAERRQRLGTGGRSAFAFLAAGGFGPKPVGPRLELEGYAQAGIVGLPGSDGFADGRLSLDYKLTRGARHPDLAVGLVVSGGAQTGASRLDIGPQLRLRLPVAGGHLRLSAEWRERIAGTARPSSGPALTLVADF